MAEPARRLDDDSEPKRVYDTSGTAPSDPRSHLKSLEGGAETSDPKRGHLKSVDGDKDLSSQENDPSDTIGHEDKVGRGYSKAAGTSRFNLRAFATNRRRSLMIGGGAAALVTVVFTLLFLSLLPLKILHIVNNLQDHFYAASQGAVQKETDQLLSKHIRRSLWSVKCKAAVIDKNCTPASLVSTNPVEKLYRSWSNAKLENKLSNKYGIEFKYNNTNGHYYIKMPSLSNDVEIDDFMNSGESLDTYFRSSPKFQKVSRTELRQAVRTAFDTETRWKPSLIRFKTTRLLEQKYGIPRCIIFCGTRDRFADSVTNQKNAAKIAIARLVFETRNQELNIAIQCLLDTTCDPSNTKDTPPCQEGINCELSNAPENAETDTKIRTTLDDYAARYGLESSDSLVALYTELEEKGLSQYMIEKVFAYLFGDAAGQAASQNVSDAIPIIGWVNLAAQIVGNANSVGPKLKKLDYIVNSASAVSIFATYRVYADEIKTGKVNANEVGSLVKSLGPIADTTGLKDVKGGTAEAEQTPLYNYLINGQGVSGSKNYTCSDGKPPTGGSIDNAVCPEEKPGQGNNIANFIHNALKLPGLDVVVFLADLWNGSVGKILSFVSNIFGFLTSTFINVYNYGCSVPQVYGIPPEPADLLTPGYCDAREKIKAAASAVANMVINYLIPNPFGQNMSGGRTFDMIAAGADVSGNDYAHNGIGGQVLTPQQTADIINDQASQDIASHNQQSILGRIFNQDDRYSMVNKVALAMPSSTTDMKSSVVSILKNPFGLMAHNFGGIFGHAQAATATTDPFGITQYGYPLDDPIFTTDPSSYWDQHCTDNPAQAYQNDAEFKAASWNALASADSSIDPVTGMPTNTTTNPCMLLKAATGSAGAIFDSSLLTADDLADSNASTTTPTSTTGQASAPSASLQNLAKQILATANVSYPLDAISTNGSTKAVLQALAAGQAAPVTCQDGSAQGVTSANLNPNILQAILDMAQSSKIGVNALTDKCHSVGSNHYKGLAVDFECSGIPFDLNKNDAIAAKYGGQRNSETCSSNGHWHYDFIGP